MTTKNLSIAGHRLLWLVLWASALGAVAQSLPFKTTTITAGDFASDTPWYTMTIGNAKLLISNPGSASSISLNQTLRQPTDDDLWCFVGNDTDGYQIYNKAAGVGKVLSAPTTMTGSNGGASYVVLRDAAQAEAAGYTGTWLFATSANIEGESGVYMYEKGYTANKVNNRDGKLAFWTKGQDHGSTLVIKFAEQRIRVNADNGSFTASNNARTYHSQWTSTQADPQVSLNVAKNNMDLVEGSTELRLYSGGANSYSLQTTSDYVIKSFEFDFYNYDSSKEMTVTSGEATATAEGSNVAHFEATDINEQVASFLMASPAGAAFICTDNFYVTVGPNMGEPVATTELFITQSGAIPYRIPAIATASNGDVIAISDYRYCRSDIGNGRIDLYQRISHDNGETWEPYTIVVSGDGVLDSRGRNYSLTAGYGDACIVADRESSEVLLMSVCGYQTFHASTRQTPNQVARFRSHDNGQTWSQPEVITDMFYTPFDENCSQGPIRSMFIGSGKIHQSRYVKVGQYYRLYCSSLTKNVNGTNVNYVWYSDDFGETWKVLGDVNVPAIPSGADEPKTEELPDGSVVVSSRVTGGRIFNIFRFTNPEAGEGSWQNHANSNSSNGGTVAVSNSCNGEIMMLPARRKSDNKAVYVALQSVPFGSGRSNVGIYYKEIASAAADYSDPYTFASNWDGNYKISSIGSAYSTMTLQAEGRIGFLYEETTYGADYTIVYRPLTLEEITDSAYAYDPTITDADLGLINVTYVLMENDEEVARTVVKQEKNSSANVPQSWMNDEYNYEISGTIGADDCTISVVRTLKPNHTRIVRRRVDNLEVGKSYAIFNTAMNGTQARYGFYYAGNSSSLYAKSMKPSDFTPSDVYLWTVESGGAIGTYAFRNNSTQTYISYTQRALSSKAEAWQVEEWTASGEQKSTVNSLADDGTVVDNASITTADKVFIVYNPSGTDRARCWNGNDFSAGDGAAPALWGNAHPFAFYEYSELTYVYVTYVLMEGDEEVDRLVVEQEANSAVAIPQAWQSGEGQLQVEGQIGNENCTIKVKRIITGIESLKNANDPANVFDLHGRKLKAHEAQKGIYVVDGKKRLKK